MKIKFKNILISILLIVFSKSSLAQEPINFLYKNYKKELIELSKKIDVTEIDKLPIHHNGRIKPLNTYTRESLLFVTGKYSKWGLSSTQLYLALIVYGYSRKLELINIRDTDLRVKLGFSKSNRSVSIDQLDQSLLHLLAKPLVEKQKLNENLLDPDEKKILELNNQYWLFRLILSSAHFVNGVQVAGSIPNPGAPSKLSTLIQTYLKLLIPGAQETSNLSIKRVEKDLLLMASQQKMPKTLKPNLDKLELEVFYNWARLFLISSLIYIFFGILLFFPGLKAFFSKRNFLLILLLPMGLHLLGFIIRIYITEFPPVTNMYGTMLWVSFGLTIFSTALFMIYRNQILVGFLITTSGLILLLAENIPLILSPDMDPIVAVLRSSFWLTIHVLTITISYAAFSVAMVIGNVALLRKIFYKASNDDAEVYKRLAHQAYRIIQLGVMLITAGIILGGIWADYSWGRFWGWDPKETWALIADLGFIAILHSRYLGWLKDFGLLAASTVAYLLVIMAWYGVNFILAAGLHSYGFSSGGATLVSTYVLIQLFFLGLGLISHKLKKPPLLNSRPS